MLGKHLCNIFTSVLSDDIIWKFSYGGNNYQKMKYTVLNTLMLIRVWQEGLGIQMKGRKNVFAGNRIDQNNIAKSNILSEWSWMFQKYISVFDAEKISIGQYCVFKDVSFRKKYLEQSFENCSFERVSFEHSFLQRTGFTGCIFSDETSFENATLYGVDFSDASLQEVNFNGATLRECIILDVRIENVDFSACKIENCTFSGSFKNVSFAGAVLRDNKWINADFVEIDFSDAIISNEDSRQLESM